MPLVYKLVGFDPIGGRQMERHDIPTRYVLAAKKVAGMDPDDPNISGDVPLAWAQAEKISDLIGERVHKEMKYFLVTYERGPLQKRLEHELLD